MVQQPSQRRLIRRKQLEQKIGLGRSAIYDRLNTKSAAYDPEFPRPIELGTGKNPPVAWDENEVDVWIAKQIERRRKAAGSEADTMTNNKKGRPRGSSPKQIASIDSTRSLPETTAEGRAAG